MLPNFFYDVVFFLVTTKFFWSNLLSNFFAMLPKYFLRNKWFWSKLFWSITKEFGPPKIASWKFLRKVLLSKLCKWYYCTWWTPQKFVYFFSRNIVGICKTKLKQICFSDFFEKSKVFLSEKLYFCSSCEYKKIWNCKSPLDSKITNLPFRLMNRSILWSKTPS